VYISINPLASAGCERTLSHSSENSFLGSSASDFNRITGCVVQIECTNHPRARELPCRCVAASRLIGKLPSSDRKAPSGGISGICFRVPAKRRDQDSRQVTSRTVSQPGARCHRYCSYRVAPSAHGTFLRCRRVLRGVSGFSTRSGVSPRSLGYPPEFRRRRSTGRLDNADCQVFGLLEREQDSAKRFLSTLGCNARWNLTAWNHDPADLCVLVR